MEHSPLPLKSVSPPGSLGELLRVALPLVISSGSNTLLYVVDRIFLTWYSDKAHPAIAAALPAGMLHWTLLSLGFGTVSYVNAFVAQFDGAGEPRRVGAILWQGIYLSLIAAGVVMAFVPFAPAFFEWFGHDPEVRRLETVYFNVLCLGSGPLLLSTTLACFFSGRGQTLPIMWVNIAVTIVHIVLDYVLIFGFAGSPAFGMAGAAAATAISYAVGAVLYVLLLVFGRGNGRYALWAGRRFDRELFTRLLRFGIPNGVQMFIDVVAFTIFIQIVAGMGTTEMLAANNLTFNLNALVFIPLNGLGTAVMTLTGQRIGARQPELAVRTVYKALALALVYVSGFCVVYLFAPNLILSPYAYRADPETFAGIQLYIVGLLRFVALYSFFDAMAVLFSAAIRGAGDTRFALRFSCTTSILVMVLPTYLAAHYWNAGLDAAWISVSAAIIVLGIGFWIRFHQGRWKHMRLTGPAIEPEESMATAV